MKLIDGDDLKRDLLNNRFDDIMILQIIDDQPELTLIDPAIVAITTSAAPVSGIPWKKVRKLVNDSIAAGANVDISCEADGSWNIAIYPPEKKTTITVPSDGGINTIPYIQPVSPYVAPVDPITITCNTGENNV